MLQNLGDQDAIGKSGYLLCFLGLCDYLLVDEFGGIYFLTLKVEIHQIDHVHVHVRLVVGGQQIL